MGGIDDWLTDEGERSWMLSTYEGVGEDWDEGNYGSAIWGGLKLGGAGTLGALGGLGGGIVDAASAVGGGISDAASYIGDNTTLDPSEIDWGRTFSPWNW
jgi:hypothetical protein